MIETQVRDGYLGVFYEFDTLRDTRKGFASEAECLLLEDAETRVPRCHWEPKSYMYDCALLWPATTTTTTAPGCCRGESYKASDECSVSRPAG